MGMITKPHKTRREVEALITATMRLKYPALQHVGLMLVTGTQVRCFLRWQLTETAKAIPPIEEAEALLAELQTHFEIVQDPVEPIRMGQVSGRNARRLQS